MGQKYYWMLTLENGRTGIQYKEFMTRVHPLVASKDKKTILLNWKEITKKEFSLIKE